MLTRYKKEQDGSNVPVAQIYSAKEHAIDSRSIDLDAIWAIRKLKQSGAEAYVVGGAVRDLLLGRKPKDFDISTSATPRQVQKLFWNARIIGKRFKLVHLVFKDKILEVSTFRSGDDAEDEGSSIYGTIEQDAKRRDFSVNSLYYDPTDGQLIDFNHAMQDIKRKRIRSILPLPGSFSEDPVRMIRAIKYSVTTSFALQFDIRRAIRKSAGELARVSSSRLTEEVSKILSSGDSAKIFRELQRYKLMVFLLPCVSVCTRMQDVYDSLEELDAKVREAKQSADTVDETLKGEMIAALVRAIIVWPEHDLSPEDAFKEVYGQVKTLISPMTPPNYDVEHAAVILLDSRDVSVPKHCLRARRPMRQPGTMGFKTKPQKGADQGRKVRKGQTASIATKRRRRRNPVAQPKEGA
ncbi:MAG: polynucleotide adenylyltransferase PcnB [Sphaerochaetaceae bacterium]|nr:polynucleotide adenylyltransferase PcnB [Sphaerochaetaceae bacterium]